MKTKILALGIEDEYEGDGPLWFDLSDPQRLADYLKDNVELGEIKKFKLKEFTKKELASLSND